MTCFLGINTICDRRLRVYIFKRQDMLVLVYFCRRDISRRDRTENAVHFILSFLSPASGAVYPPRPHYNIMPDFTIYIHGIKKKRQFFIPLKRHEIFDCLFATVNPAKQILYYIKDLNTRLSSGPRRSKNSKQPQAARSIKKRKFPLSGNPRIPAESSYIS